jgi:hypothetical protein
VISDQTSDPFERAAQREERMRQWGQHSATRQKRRLSARLKWLALFVFTLPFHLLLTDWQVTTLVIVQIALITFTAILAAWAWIDNRTGTAWRDRT